MKQKYAAPAASRLTPDFWPTVKVYLGPSWLMSHIAALWSSLTALKMTPKKRSRQMPSIMKLISLSALCIHARCSSPDTRTALCSGARNTRLDDEARSVTHPSLCSSLSCHSCDCINRLLCIFVSYIFIGLLQSVTCIFHFRVSWPQKSSKSLCVIQRISKHIWKCVKIIWGQPCKMILNFNTHFNVAKIQTQGLMLKFPN